MDQIFNKILIASTLIYFNQILCMLAIEFHCKIKLKFEIIFSDSDSA